MHLGGPQARSPARLASAVDLGDRSSAGLLAAAAAGLVAIAFLLRYLRSHPMTVFVAYRLVLAAIVVVHFLAA